MENIVFKILISKHPIPLSPLLMMVLPSFHAWFNLHRFIRACHHSYKHFPSLWVVLSLQVFIHTVLYVRSQSCCLQPYNRQAQGRSLKRVKSVSWSRSFIFPGKSTTCSMERTTTLGHYRWSMLDYKTSDHQYVTNIFHQSQIWSSRPKLIIKLQG